jgi:hypothetical protein
MRQQVFIAADGGQVMDRVPAPQQRRERGQFFNLLPLQRQT